MNWLFGRKSGGVKAAEGGAAQPDAPADETAPLALWGRASSINVQKPLWLLQRLGVAHTRIDAGGPFGGLDAPEFRAMNPHGLVPVLVDRRLADSEPVVIFESNAILRYLGSVETGAEALWPGDAGERAHIDKWMEWAQTTVHGALQPLFISIIRSAASERDPAALKAMAARLTAAAQAADARLADSAYLAGERFTLADIVLGSALHRYFTIEITRPETPALSAYHQRLMDDPQYSAVVAVDYDAMRVPGAARSETPLA